MSLPETLEVKLVPATVLGDYEVYSLAASISFSTAVGFAVAFFQSIPAASAASAPTWSLLATAVMFIIVGVVLLIGAGAKRHILYSKSRKVSFRLSDPIDE